MNVERIFNITLGISCLLNGVLKHKLRIKCITKFMIIN